jgi:hypothetical protein
VGYGPDGFYASLIETAPWIGVLDAAMEFLVEATDHRICCKIPEAAWKIPLSEETYEDGSPKESLGSFIYDLTSKIETFLWDQEKEILSLPISEDTARMLSPDFASSLLDEEE